MSEENLMNAYNEILKVNPELTHEDFVGEYEKYKESQKNADGGEIASNAIDFVKLYTNGIELMADFHDSPVPKIVSYTKGGVLSVVGAYIDYQESGDYVKEFVGLTGSVAGGAAGGAAGILIGGAVFTGPAAPVLIGTLLFGYGGSIGDLYT